MDSEDFVRSYIPNASRMIMTLGYNNQFLRLRKLQEKGEYDILRVRDPAEVWLRHSNTKSGAESLQIIGDGIKAELEKEDLGRYKWSLPV